MTKSHDSPARRALTLDTAKYQSYLDDTQIPDDQKTQLIETLWVIVVAFIDLGYEINAGNTHKEDCCGKAEFSDPLQRESGLKLAKLYNQGGGARD